MSPEASDAVRRLLELQAQLTAQAQGQVIANGHPSDEPEVDQHDYMSSAPSPDTLLGRKAGELSARELDQVLRWTGGSLSDGQMLDIDEDITSFSAGGDIFGEIAAAAASSNEPSYGGVHNALAAGLLPPQAIDSDQGVAGSALSRRSAYADADWIPKVSTDGRVFAYNTRTGDSAMDFPLSTSSGLPVAAKAMIDRYRTDSGVAVSDKSKWISDNSSTSRSTRYTDETSTRGLSNGTLPTSLSMPTLSSGPQSRMVDHARPASMYSNHSALDTCLTSFQTSDLGSLQSEAALIPRKGTLASTLDDRPPLRDNTQSHSDSYLARQVQLSKMIAQVSQPTPHRTLEQYQHDCEDALGLVTDAVQIHGSATRDGILYDADSSVLRRQRLAEAAEAVSTATKHLLVATDFVIQRQPSPKRVSASAMSAASALSGLSSGSNRGSVQIPSMCPSLDDPEIKPLAMRITATESKLALSIRSLWGLLETTEQEEAAVNFAREVEYLTPEEKAAHAKKRSALLITRRDIDAKLRYDLLVQVRMLGEDFSTFMAAVQDHANRRGVKADRAGLLLPERSEASFASSAGAIVLSINGLTGAATGHGFRAPLKLDTSPTTPIAQHFLALSSSARSLDRPCRPLEPATVQSLQSSAQVLAESVVATQTLLKTMCGSGSNTSIKSSLLKTVANQLMQLLTKLASFNKQVEEVDLAGRLDVHLDVAIYGALTGESVERILQRGIFASKSPIAGSEAYEASLREAHRLLCDLSDAKKLIHDVPPSLVSVLQALSADMTLAHGLRENHSTSAGSPFASPIGAGAGTNIALPVASVSELFESLAAVGAATERMLQVMRSLLVIADQQAASAPALRKANMALRADLAALSMPQSSTPTHPSRLSRDSSALASGLGVEDELAEELDSARGYGPNGFDGSSAGASTLYFARGINDSRATVGSTGQMQRTASVQSSLYKQALGRSSRSNSLAESFMSDDSYRNGVKRDAADQDLTYTSGSTLLVSRIPEAHIVAATSPTNHSPSKSKLKQFFGADAPGQNIHRPPTAVKEMPSFLQSDYTHDQISYANDGSIRAGTLHALVCRLTNHMSADRQYNDAFLMTYKTFCTSQALLGLLKDRYNLEPPPGISQQDFKMWVEQKQKLVRFRVIGALRSWITDNLYDDDESLLDQISAFAVVLPGESSQQLARIIERRVRDVSLIADAYEILNFPPENDRSATSDDSIRLGWYLSTSNRSAELEKDQVS